jgi:hypothetical protein
MVSSLLRSRFSLVFPAVCVFLFSCRHPDVVIDVERDVYYPSFTHKLDVNSAGYGLTKLDGLSKNDELYLARIKNTRIRWDRSVAMVESGAEAEDDRSLAEIIVTEDGETLFRYERHWQATPPSQNTQTRNMVRALTGSQVAGVTKKNFYADISPYTDDPAQVSATLRYIGDFCKVWVVDSYFDNSSSADDKVNQNAVEHLAKKFDEIYPIATSILGYEYGGGPGGQGGMDGDPKVQILLFDIDGDNSANGSVTYGYFYSGDALTRRDSPYSNEAEIFYIDTVELNRNPIAIYSTLIHEFNHMINFNLKVIEGNGYQSWNTEVWYTEMLSMLAEDVIGPMIDIPISHGSHVVRSRIPKWLVEYADLSVMYWPSSSDDAVKYYSSNYAFGAYLVRNFGGPKLFSLMAKSALSGRGSVDSALRSLNGKEIDSFYAMSRFGEALLYSARNKPKEGFTFDESVEAIIDGISAPYVFYGFDIYDFFSPELAGPVIRDYKDLPKYTALSNTVQLYTDTNWSNEIARNNGRLEIRLLNVDPDADYYIITK